MKKLLNVLLLTLAINFIAAVGAVVFLFQSGKLDSQKIKAIKEIMFADAAASTQPAAATQPTSRPLSRVEQLLEKQVGRSASEQLAFIRETIDAQLAQIDRQREDVAAMEAHVAATTQQVQRDRLQLAEERRQLEAEKKKLAQSSVSQGFQESLDRYNAMSAKQVKTIFMSLDDNVVVQYLRAMEPRTAAKIIKEFKTDAEVERVHQILERMRLQNATTKEAVP